MIQEKISLDSIMKQLYEGKSIIHLFRIGEGATKYEVNEKINETINKFTDITINSLPENLIADTYDYTTNDSLESFIRNITQVSQKRALKIWKNRDKGIPLKSIDDLFIIASIIEKETGQENEKEIIASVFYNRLNENMKLQSDPTVIFSLKKGKRLKRKLTRDDLKNKSPYNTYYTRGLPPSPICYPSLSSLKAASKPLDTDFLYFVADGSGGHIFSKNYKDHLYNVKRFRNARKKNQR